MTTVHQSHVHSSPARAAGAVHQAVAALGEVVDQVQDVVNEVALAAANQR